MNEKNMELKNCIFFKTILMMLVVLGHSVHMWTGDWFTKNPVFQSPVLGVISEVLSSFHIYAFTLISGYIFYYVKYEAGRYNNRRRFVINKAQRLLIPYLFAASVWVGPIQQCFFHYDIKHI